MKIFSILIAIGFFFELSSFACSGCSKSKSSGISANIQSSPGSNSASLSGSRIIGSVAGQQTRPFKNDKIFDSVGKDQGETDPNWKSSISE